MAFASAIGAAGGGGCAPDEIPARCTSLRCVPGNVCVEGQCRLRCTRHDDCPEDQGYACREGIADEGAVRVSVCKKTGAPKSPGGYGTACGQNLDGDCDVAAGFACVGRAAEADAFCTRLEGCAADGDCPADMWCSTLRRPACVSNKECASDAACDLVAGWRCEGWLDGTKRCVIERSCHTSPDDCDPGTQCTALRGPDGAPATARACVPRRYCAPCEADADCVDANGACIPDARGGRVCSVACQPGGSTCDPGSECRPAGGRTVCVPRGGSCRPDPGPCAFCRDDGECGPGGLCEVYVSTRERFCAEPCPAGGCAAAPAGDRRVCCADSSQCEPAAIGHCVPEKHSIPYPASAWGCWLRACSRNGECAPAEVCDVRAVAKTDLEVAIACGTQGICRPARDPTDSKSGVCDCAGSAYASEAVLAKNPAGAFKGCCQTVTIGATKYTCSP